MGLTVSSLLNVDVSALHQVAESFGGAHRHFGEGCTRVTDEVQSPLAGGAAWTGEGQPAALTTVSINTSALSISALRMSAAREIVSALAAALDSAQGMLRSAVREAEHLGVTLDDDLTLSGEGLTSLSPLDGPRITNAARGAVVFAAQADTVATTLLDRISASTVRFSDTADATALRGNASEYVAAVVDVALAANARAYWSSTTPMPLIEGAAYPTQGPAIGNGREIAYLLPWPGSYSVSNSTGAGPYSTVTTYTASKGSCSLDGSGAAKVTVSVSADVRMNTEVVARLKSLGIVPSSYSGTEMTYSVTTDPTTADAIADAGEDPVSPIDPRSIPPGAAITLGEEDYTGSGLAVAYGALQTSLGYREGERVSSSIEALGDGTMRISVGDEDVISRSGGVGIGFDKAYIGIGASSSFTDGRLRTVDVDVTTPAGWDAYQRFLVTGELPASGADGTADETISDLTTSTNSSAFEARLGRFSLSAEQLDTEAQMQTTQHADGTIDYSQVSRNDGVTQVSTVEEDAQGEVVDTTHALHLRGIDDDYVRGFLDASGTDTSGIDGDSDVTLTFDDAQVEEIRDQALQVVTDRVNDSDLSTADRIFGSEATPEEIADYLGDHRDGGDLADITGSAAPGDASAARSLHIAAAESPDDVVDAIASGQAGNGHNVLLTLQDLAYGELDDPAEITERMSEITTVTARGEQC
ncbi:MAG: hypothetical protein GEV10_01925 [Streptosporangiales bacterium]|nr:hypothetical protein [Streptosporangiales bacterium]